MQQATITMGYFFSPFVMSRLNTRPLFIATLLISAVAQVYFYLHFVFVLASVLVFVFVMSLLNTCPQFITALLISTVAQVIVIDL